MKQISWPENQAKLPVGRAVIMILLSTLLISGSAGLGLLYYQQIRELRARDPEYQITAIVQTGPERNQLETEVIAKLIGLNDSEPKNLYQFNVQEAKEILLNHPLFKEAEVKKIPFNAVYIDYVLRKPIASLGDFSNTVFDSEGVPFPKNPFFPDRDYPKIVLGIREMEWGKPIQGRKMELALQLYRELSGKSLRFIDVSKAFSPSYGERQIVLGLQNHTIRLSTKDYAKELENYERLLVYLKANSLLEGELVIDLRIPQLGFVTNS